MQFKFNAETINKVKSNWLFRENQSEFANLETDSDIALTFVRISNMNGGAESMLANEISKKVISQTNHFKK